MNPVISALHTFLVSLAHVPCGYLLTNFTSHQRTTGLWVNYGGLPRLLIETVRIPQRTADSTGGTLNIIFSRIKENTTQHYFESLIEQGISSVDTSEGTIDISRLKILPLCSYPTTV